jgi:hypothetical protein
MEDLWEGERPDHLAVGTSNQPSTDRYVSDVLSLTLPFRYRCEADDPNYVSPEMMVCRSPYVKYCAMFGTNRPCVGILIEPDGDNVEIFDPAEGDLLRKFRNSVW